MGKVLSTSFFICAAILFLFAFASLSDNPGIAWTQIALGALMTVAGVSLRTGTAAARWFGLAAAGTTTAVGAVALLSRHGYVPGTIVAIFALFRLADAGAYFGAGTPSQPAAGHPVPGARLIGGYPQGQVPGYPQGQVQGYPQVPGGVPPMGYPPGQVPGYPPGPAQGYPQVPGGVPPMGYPQAPAQPAAEPPVPGTPEQPPAPRGGGAG